MGKPVVHFEIGCRDTAAASRFYAQIFDWSLTPAGQAVTVDTGSTKGVHGHLTALGHEPFRYTMFYIEVDDIPSYLEKINSQGGQTLIPPVRIPTGTFAWFNDPDGNTVGLWTPEP